MKQEIDTPKMDNQRFVLGFASRSFRINSKQYNYEGPLNSDTAILISRLAEMEQLSEKNEKGIFSQFYQLYLKKERELGIRRSFFDNNFQFNLNEVIKTVVYWSSYISAVRESTKIQNDMIVENDSTRKSIAQLLPLYALLYTLFSQIFQQIHSKKVWLLLFFFQVFIPFFVMIGYHFNLLYGDFNFSQDFIGLGFCITSIAIFFNSIINKAIFYFLKKLTNKFIATLLNCGLFILLSYCIIFKIIIFILILEQNTQSYVANQIGDILGPPIFVVLFFSSIFILKALFLENPELIQFELNQIGKRNGPNQKFQSQYLNYQLNQKIAQKFQRAYCFKLSYFLISLCYIVVEFYFYVNFMIELKAPEVNIANIVSFTFLLIAAPCYFIIGTIILNLKSSNFKIYLLIPLVCGALLSLLTVQLSIIMNNTINFRKIASLIKLSPIMITVVWLTIRFFKQIRFSQKVLSLTGVCYCFVFPLGVMFTLSEIYGNTTLRIVGFVFLSLGLFPIVIMLIYYLFVCIIYIQKLPQQAPKYLFEAYKWINLKHYARWLNAILYTISFYSLSDVILSSPSSTTATKNGTIIGLLVIHTATFILTAFALQYNPIQQQLDPYPQTKTSQQNQLHDSLKLITLCGIIMPLFIIMPLSLILFSTGQINEMTKITLLSISLAIPVTFAYFYFQIKLKRDLISYANFLQPLFVILIWIFILVPVGVVFPILTDLHEKQSPVFAMLAQLAVGYIIMIVILSVTANAIFYSVLLNKEHLEMKKNKVLTVVMTLLAQKKVQSQEEICAMIFLRYIQEENPIKLKQDLINGDPVNVWEYPGQDKGIQFEQILITKEDYEARKKYKQLEAFKKRQSTIRRTLTTMKQPTLQNEDYDNKLDDEGIISNISDCLYQCIFCKYGQFELEEMAKRQKQLEELEKQKLEQLKQQKLQTEYNQRKEQRKSILLMNPNIENQNKDFYKQLKMKTDDRAERFWLAVYQVFQFRLATVLEFLELEKDDDILEEQYPSYKKIGENDFTMSIEDFALFLHDNFSRSDKITYSTTLHQQAMNYYKIFVSNHKKELSEIFTKPNNQTAFHKFNPKDYPLAQRQQLQLFENSNFLKQFPIQHIDEPIVATPCKLKIWKCCNYIYKTLWISPIQYTQKFMGLIASSFFPKIEIPVIQNPDHNEEWAILAVKVCDTLVEECNKFEDHMKNKENQFRISSTNILAVIQRILDTYSLATLAFKPQVGWFEKRQSYDPIESVDYSGIWNEYNFFFSLVLVMSITYVIFGIKATEQIQKNTFGYDDNKKIATWKHFNFWLSKTIQFISGQFIFVMKTYIDSVVCDYSTFPYTLLRQRSIECLSGDHFIYIAFAIIGCSIYYPLSTYIQPTFQYMDNSLDLKYISSYVVLQIQAKLLILGLSSVFSNFQGQAYVCQMLFSSFVVLLLLVFNYRLFPCYVRWFNIIDFGLLSFLFFFYFGAFLVMVTKNSQIGVIFILVCVIVSVCMQVYLLYRKYKQFQRIQNNQIHPFKETEISPIISTRSPPQSMN